ncbi:MAG TPA: shikimate dehydrogenase [Solirubrobacterales bacterium]|nr:shikimate dehydrogenase [Solirubrobacterales bacterium]
MKKLAVIGHPVGHSRSPAMQTAALEALGLAPEWTYEAIEVAPEDFEAKVREMAASGEFVGANVTIPHKEAALALADGRSAAAIAIGAANTLSFAEGRVEADNTDAGGLLASLPRPSRARRALVLGAGGAARAAIWALARGPLEVNTDEDPEREEREPIEVDVWNRTAARAEAIAAEIGGLPVDEPRQRAYGLIVNTTAVGLRGEDPFEQLPLEPDRFTSEQVVIDMVYGEGPGRLLEAAGRCGAGIVDGIEILVQQGALSLQIWTGEAPDLDTMRTAARG